MDIECRHHWHIEIANGPMSEAVCAHCGARRSFFNTAPDNRRAKRRDCALPSLTKEDMKALDNQWRVEQAELDEIKKARA